MAQVKSMTSRSDAELVKRLKAFVVGAAVFSMVFAVSGLVGWALNLPALVSWGDGTAMAPNAAACFLLAGLSLFLLREKDKQPLAPIRKLIARASAAMLGLTGLLTLTEKLSGHDLGIDRLLLLRSPGPPIAAARVVMSPVAAGAFLLLSLALLMIDWRTRGEKWPAQFICLAAAFAPLFGVLGWILGPGSPPITLAWPAVVGFAMLTAALLCSRAPWAMGGVLIRQRPGAKMLRGAFPLVLLVLCILGWLLSKPLLNGVHFTWAEVTVLAIVTGSMIGAFVGWTAFIVDRSDRERTRLEEALQLREGHLDRLLNTMEEPETEVRQRKLVKAGVAGAVLLTGLLGMLSWRIALQAAEDVDWVAHSHEVSATLELTLRHLTDVETGARGFALTGHEPFLEPYNAGSFAVTSDLQKLRTLFADPDQLRRLDVLAEQAKIRLDEAADLVAARRQSDDAPSIARLKLGKLAMDAVRSTVQEMEAQEKRLVEERTVRARGTRRFTSSAIGLDTIFAIIFLSIAGLTVNREIRVAARAQAQVKAFNVDLEQRVEQRTAALRSEIAVRRRTEEMRERLAAIVESSDDAIISKTLDGTVAAWNRGAEKVFGYAAVEMVGKSILVLVPPGRKSEELDIMARIKRGESVEHFETIRVRKDGTSINVSVTISPIRDGDGAIVGASKVARDITERKQAEAALREKECRLSESQRIAHIGSWACDLNDGADRLVWSDELYRLYGVSSETFVPTMGSLLSLVVSEDRGLLQNWMTACAAGEQPADLDFRVGLPDGTVRVFSRRGELQRDSDNNPIRLVGTSQDITERRQTEAALKETEEQLLAVANGIPQLAWIAGADGTIYWYNQRWYQFTGTSLAQMQGSGWQRVHHPDYLAEVLARWTRAIAEGEPFEMEFPLRGASGQYHAFLTRVMPLKDSAGRVIRWFGTNTDISKIKQTEERLATQAEELSRHRAELLSSQTALQAQTSMLKLVLESTGEGLVAADHEGQFLLWNSAASTLLGRDAANLPPEKWSSHYACYLPDGITPCPTQELPLVRALNGESLQAELIIRQTEMQDTFVEFSGRPMRDAAGNVCGGVVAFRDITRRKTDEREIRKLNEDLEERIAKRTAQLASANHELEAFSYSVSHDLRTPLRHIAGFSAILVNNYGPVMALEAREYLQLIEDAVRRMGLLVEGLLSLAKLGQQSLKLRVTELNPMVEEVVSMLRPECEGRDVEWRVAKLPALECDPILMAQVFQNLLGNAMKYSRGRAKPVIEVGSIQRAGKPAIIFVRDNGAGFDLRYAEKLFGVFQRFHSASEFEGTGVGLATVHRIIQKHGGTIWAESEPERGATFYFALQVTDQIGTRSTATAAT